MSSDFILAPGEEMVQCPYSTAHLVTNARFLTHLEKCRRQYKKEVGPDRFSKDMKICRHNALHHCPKPEIKWHEAHCKDAHSVIRHLAWHNSREGQAEYERRQQEDAERDKEWQYQRRSGGGSRGDRYFSKSPPRESAGASAVPVANYGIEEEDWEKEADGYTAGYDPQIKLKSEIVMYVPAGMTKSQRKQFRKDQAAAAVARAEGKSDVEIPTAADFDVKPDISKLKENPPGGKPKEETKVRVKKQPTDLSDGEISGSDEERNRSSEKKAPATLHNYDFSYNFPSASASSSSRAGAGASSRRTFKYEKSEIDDMYDSDDFAGYDPFEI